jgi:hypothetical protein
MKLLRRRNKMAMRPIIVCLCGSTRFKEAFDEANYQLTMKGKIVLSVGFFMHASGNRHGNSIGCTPAEKIALDELHKSKIDLADEILVLNVNGYIGESTRSEINYAKMKGKRIYFLEKISDKELHNTDAIKENETLKETIRIIQKGLNEISELIEKL